jgi:hypothetical protein
MPESFELIFWGIILATLWLRGLRRAARRHHEASENEDSSREGTGVEVESDLGGMPRQRGRSSRSTLHKVDSDVSRSVSLAERGRTIRGQLTTMARQVERQMQEAAGEGRSGSLVAHVEDDDLDETILGAGRKVLREGTPSILTTPPAVGSRAATVPQRGMRSYKQSSTGVTRVRGSRSHETRELGYLNRYPPLQRAVIFAEILAPPVALRGDERDLHLNR